jgi:ElaB/YqjD/DUF883 family membrane-anchored ribosome-binding protein
LIELAIAGLSEAKRRIDAELADLFGLADRVTVLTDGAPVARKLRSKAVQALKTGRKKMSPAKKKALSAK